MLTAVACALALAVPPPAADAPKENEPADWQGAWTLESLEIDGKTVEPFGRSRARLVIDGAKLLYGGEEIASLTADARATPKIVDLTFSDPKKTVEGIYTVEKDTLRICLNVQTEGAKERPQDFSTEDKANRRVLVLQRDRTEASDNTAGLTGFVGLALTFAPDSKEVIVSGVLGKSAAEKAGLKKEDVVLKVGDVEVTDLASAIDAVRGKPPGSDLRLHIRRDGKEQDIVVKVGVMPFALLAHLE
jgi:uncharacterized protein (TIGR03067 family)